MERRVNTFVKMSIILLILAFLFIPLASVRDDMAGIPTVDSLESFYYENNDYVHRYVLKELPDWLNRRGLPPDMPDWGYDALEDALSSYRPLLIREAVILTGRYSINEFTDRMAEIYKAAHRWFPADADIVRSEILRALLKIGGVSAETYIPDLFLNSERYLISNEFKVLLSALDQYGTSVCIEELQFIEKQIADIIADISADPLQDPSQRSYKHFSDLAGYVTVTKDRLIEKEAGDE